MAERDDHVAARLTACDAAQLGEQVAGLARAGLPMASGLKALGAELPAGRLRLMIDALARTLEGGASLDEAFEAQRHRLPAYLRGLVRAGERTGRTGEILGRFAGYASIGADARRLLWLNLAYPVIALSMALAVLLFILTYIVGGFEQIFKDFGIALPTMSWVLIELSGQLRNSAWILLEGLAALGAIAFATMLAVGPAARRSVAGHIPLLGPVWRWTSLAEFFHLLGLLLESELALIEAIPMAGEGVPDRGIQQVAGALTRDLAGGDSLSAAVGRRSFFPDGLGQIVAWAEQHQSLPGALHMLAEMYEVRARAQAVLASTVFSVLTVLSILAGIVAVIAGVLAPMLTTIRSLSA